MQQQFKGSIYSLDLTMTRACAEHYKLRLALLDTDRDSILLAIVFWVIVILRITCEAEPVCIHISSTLKISTLYHALSFEGSAYWDPSTDMCGVISRAAIIRGGTGFWENMVYLHVFPRLLLVMCNLRNKFCCYRSRKLTRPATIILTIILHQLPRSCSLVLSWKALIIQWQTTSDLQPQKD